MCLYLCVQKYLRKFRIFVGALKSAKTFCIQFYIGETKFTPKNLVVFEKSQIKNSMFTIIVNDIHYLQVFIDGPYGTPSGDIFQAEHAVLIGAGIGVTPFASILQSIVLRYRNARQVCPRCNHGWTGYIPTSVMRLKKVCRPIVYMCKQSIFCT